MAWSAWGVSSRIRVSHRPSSSPWSSRVTKTPSGRPCSTYLTGTKCWSWSQSTAWWRGSCTPPPVQSSTSLTRIWWKGLPAWIEAELYYTGVCWTVPLSPSNSGNSIVEWSRTSKYSITCLNECLTVGVHPRVCWSHSLIYAVKYFF